MNKKILIGLIIGTIIILPIAWYLISPAFIVKEAHEASPLDVQLDVQEETKIGDTLDTMDVDTLNEFVRQTDEKSTEIMTMADSMPSTPIVLSEATFQPRAHGVQGKALLIETDGKKILRFEDFETVNGPDLRIWLSTDLSVDDYVEVSKIKATKGSVNYELDPEIDTEKYNNVLVWCKPFSVLFSYAELG